MTAVTALANVNLHASAGEVVLVMGQALTARENVRLVTAGANGVMARDGAKQMLEILGLGHRLNSLPKLP